MRLVVGSPATDTAPVAGKHQVCLGELIVNAEQSPTAALQGRVGDEVVVEGCRSERNSIGDDERPQEGDRRDLPMLYQWRLNMKTGEVTEKLLDEVWGCEFARINEDFMGIRNQYTYAARIKGDTLESGFDGIIKYDLVNGTAEHHPYGEGRLGGEPIFAPVAHWDFDMANVVLQRRVKGTVPSGGEAQLSSL